MTNRKGFTLMELVVTSMLGAMLLLVVSEILSNSSRLFHNVSVKQQLQLDGDLTMNTILHALQLGQRSTVVICSCGAVACSTTCTTNAGTTPNSRIEFKPAGNNTTTAIYQSSGTVVMKVGTRSPQSLAAQNVVGLTFTGDGQDLSRIYISLTLAAPLSGTQTETVIIPNQAVRLSQ
jgi:prepilin-type N-terminal cleavage/methylation domain-containing protein